MSDLARLTERYRAECWLAQAQQDKIHLNVRRAARARAGDYPAQRLCESRTASASERLWAIRAQLSALETKLRSRQATSR